MRYVRAKPKVTLKLRGESPMLNLPGCVPGHSGNG